ncbi:MAG TPA: nitrite reductase large subunit NirB [Polyangiales bacterium]|nr:nitrite reductase large subunit NirB [Polyangiales bacterium]
MKREAVVVVGAGMIGHRFCTRLRELDRSNRYRIVCFGEEPHAPYDRVNLAQYYEHGDADALLLSAPETLAEQNIDLRLKQRVSMIDLGRQQVRTQAGEQFAYHHLVLATGSAPFMPALPGIEKRGVFAYRTIEDLAAIRAYANGKRTVAVIGGGLLGLEAARAVQALGLETHVVELAPRLMPRQLDDAGARLVLRAITALGVEVHLGVAPNKVLGEERCEGLRLANGRELEVDMLVVSAGIRPRDELAKAAGVMLGDRGGVIVDDQMCTSEPLIYAVGEVALHRGVLYGLVAPGYEMADVLAKRLVGQDASFSGADQSAKLKLMGVDVAMFGDPFTQREPTKEIALHDLVNNVYKKLVVSDDAKRLLGGILVGDTQDYGALLSLVRGRKPLPGPAEELILGKRGEGASLPVDDDAQVCSCNNVTRGQLCSKIREGNCSSIGDLKSSTRAGTGCGGCVPMMTDILAAELSAVGKAPSRHICEHFQFSRQELFEIVAVRGYRTFGEIVEKVGRGFGCEQCKPAVASILASVHNDPILNHETVQDTNDRFLANVQRGGLYSVVPRIPGGEITPDKLIKLGEVAKKYGLYTKITGGQRIDLFGAQLNQLPDIWEELISAGFESGHAYGKAVRTVKSCVGSSWCRYGVQDSVAFAIRVEERYKGIRAPHKLKSAVSGCVRECAEAQSKDFGIIATEKGWNLYVCGNGGAKPRHADLLAADLDSDTCIRYIDRFLMFYIRTADRLTRTSTWLDKMEGGIEHLRDVIVKDSLGLCSELEREMNKLVRTYRCEWSQVVADPERRARFQHFANSPEFDPTVRFIEEREQKRPADWPKRSLGKLKLRLPTLQRRWVPLVDAHAVPRDGGIAVKYGKVQLAVFNFASRGEWYATQNMCPHRQDMVLSRGIIGDHSGQPKVACPLHKKTFALDSGECLSGDDYKIGTFAVQVSGGIVYVELPPAEALEAQLCKGSEGCATAAE